MRRARVDTAPCHRASSSRCGRQVSASFGSRSCCRARKIKTSGPLVVGRPDSRKPLVAETTIAPPLSHDSRLVITWRAALAYVSGRSGYALFSPRRFLLFFFSLPEVRGNPEVTSSAEFIYFPFIVLLPLISCVWHSLGEGLHIVLKYTHLPSPSVFYLLALGCEGIKITPKPDLSLMLCHVPRVLKQPFGPFSSASILFARVWRCSSILTFLCNFPGELNVLVRVDSCLLSIRVEVYFETMHDAGCGCRKCRSKLRIRSRAYICALILRR